MSSAEEIKLIGVAKVPEKQRTKMQEVRFGAGMEYEIHSLDGRSFGTYILSNIFFQVARNV